MKKLLLYSTLILSGCYDQSILDNVNINNIQSSINNIKKFSVITARNTYERALKQAKKTFSNPILFEIDVFKEIDAENIHFGFMQNNIGNKYNFLKVTVDVKNGKIKTQEINNVSKLPQAVDIENWKIDNTEILKIAQDNGLKDQTFLATLWEDTWHISGLKQNIYFQISSQTGKIKMICVGPYMNNCTDSDFNPIKKRIYNKFINKLSNSSY